MQYVEGLWHPLAKANPGNFAWAHCSRCEALWHYCFVMPAVVELVVAIQRKQRCPSCGAGIERQSVATPQDARRLMEAKKPDPVDEGNIEKWLRTGQVGASSKVMALMALGRPLPCTGYADYPRDPDDMGRCMKLLVAAPEVRQAFPKIAALNAHWQAIIQHWDEITALIKQEAGKPTSQFAYDRMQQIYNRVPDPPGTIRLGKGITMRVGR